MWKRIWLCVFIVFWAITTVVGAAALELEISAYDLEDVDSAFVQGVTRARAVVTILAEDGYKQEQFANEQGQFSFFDIPLIYGDNRLQVTVDSKDSQVTEVLWVRFLPPTEFLGTGFASLELGKRYSSGDASFSQQDSGFYTDTLVQFFVEGKSSGGYRLTGALDTVPHEKPESGFVYHLLGDASTKEKKAMSSLPIYAKVEKEQSSFVWGDYRTDFLQNGEFMAYNRMVTGAHVQIVEGLWRLTMGHAPTNSQFQKDFLRGKGISGLYYLSHVPVVEYSEQITLITIDRDDPESSIEAQMLIRDADYTIDYRLGSLEFRKPVPMQDAAGNPMFLSVVYEWAHGSEHAANVTSGSLVWDNTRTRAQVAGVQDGDEYLVGGNLAVSLGQHQIARGEIARSYTSADSGMAWRLGWEGTFGAAELKVSHSQKEAKFSPDLQKASDVAHRKTEGTLDWETEEYRLGVLVFSRQETGGVVTRQTDRWSVEFARNYARFRMLGQIGQTKVQSDQDPITSKTVLWGGATYQVLENTTASLGREEVFDQPSVRGIGRWDLSFRHQIVPHVHGRLGYWFSDDGRQSAIASLESEISSAEGTTTSVATSGTLSRLGDGWELQTSQGITSTLALSPNFGVDARLERISPLGVSQITAGALGFQYAFGESNHRVTGNLQRRIGKELEDQVVQFAVEGQFPTGISYQAQYRLVDNQVAVQDVRRLETAKLSLAYRPIVKHRSSVLGLWRMDRSQEHITTLSLKAATWINPRLEVGGKVAIRSVEESGDLLPSANTKTVLRQMRGSYQLAPRWDLVGSVRYLSQKSSESVHRSFAQGVRYHLTADGGYRLELGYKSEGYDAWADDPSRERHGSLGGPYVRLLVVF